MADDKKPARLMEMFINGKSCKGTVHLTGLPGRKSFIEEVFIKEEGDTATKRFTVSDFKPVEIDFKMDETSRTALMDYLSEVDEAVKVKARALQKHIEETVMREMRRAEAERGFPPTVKQITEELKRVASTIPFTVEVDPNDPHNVIVSVTLPAPATQEAKKTAPTDVPSEGHGENGSR